MDVIRRILPISHVMGLMVLLSLLQSCTMGGEFLKEANSPGEVGKNEIIVVGSIELIPKLQEGEQALDPDGVIDVFGYGDKNRNRAMVQFNKKPEATGYKQVINPELGKTFFFKIPIDNIYMVEGSVLIEFSPRGNTGKVHLPMSFKIDIKSTDKAVYIGKIIYTRDDFNSVTKVELVDEYKKSNKEFKKKFGDKFKLRRVLVEKI